MTRLRFQTLGQSSARLIALWALAFGITSAALAQSSGNLPFTYSGRITEATGAPKEGPVAIVASFWNTENDGTRLGDPIEFATVDLVQGVFSLNFSFTGTQAQDIFRDGSDPVYIEIAVGDKKYPRQRFSYIPLAMRVPVDGKSLAFDTTNGHIGIKGTKDASPGTVLTRDSNGSVKWDTLNASSLVAKTQADGAPGDNQVLTYKSGKWVAVSLPASTTGNYLSDLTGDVVASGPGTGTATLAAVALPGTATKVTFDAKGRVTSGTTLSASDVTAALGFTPLSAVSIATGAGLTGGPITGSGTISLANTTVTAGSYTRANITVDAQGRLTAAQSAPAIVDADIAAGAAISQSKISGLATSLAGKENAITAGTTSDYFRGDKTWHPLTTASVPESGTAVYYSDARARASLSATAPIAYSIISGSISISQASGTSIGYLSSSDWTSFNSKQSALGFSPVNKAGDTMSGALNLGSQKIVNLASPTVATDAATKAYADTNIGGKTFDVGTPSSGQVIKWDQSNSRFYLDADQIGENGGGIASLNNLTSASQSITTSTAGSSLGVTSNGSTHTITIPLASTSGVTAGLISNTEYASFNNKISAVTQGTGIAVTMASGTATVDLANTAVTAGAYTRANITVDAQGRITAAASAPAIIDADIAAGAAISQSKISGLATSLAAKEAAIAAGTTSQYFRGDKSWQDLTTAAVSEGGTNLYYTDARARASLSATGPVTYSVVSGAIGLSQATNSANGYLSSSDWSTFNAKQNALGYTPLNRAGDTMSGALNHGASDITNTGNIQMAASKTFALSSNTSDPAGLTNTDKGKTWYNTTSNQIKYWDGSSAVALGVAGSGLTSLNGQSGNTQTFAVPGSSGTAPAWSSAANEHTLNIPMASAAGVTAGLISNTDYSAFNSKINAVTQGTGIAVTTAGGTATVGLANTAVTAGAYTRANITVDQQGRLTAAANGANINLASEVTGVLPTANGGTGVNSTATYPAAGVVVTRDATETLTNKTLTAPLVSSFVNTGTLTLPTSTDTLVGRATTDTLTNKTLTGTTINGASSIGGSTSINTTGTATTGALTATTVTSQGNLTVRGDGSMANKLVLNDKTNTNYVAFKAPNTLAAAVTWELPSTDGTAGQVLSTNGTGTLSWVSGLPPTGAASGDLTGNYPAPTLATVGTAGNYTKVTTDSKGRVTSGTTLSSTDLPPISASSLNTGTLAVTNGGTGVSAFSNNGVVIGSSSALSSTAAGTQYNVLTVNASNQPTFGSVNLASSNAVNGTLGITNGGTGATTKTAAFDALSPMSTAGDLIYGGTAGSGSRLLGNTSSTKQFLSSTGTGAAANAPAWAALAASDLPAHSAALITSGTLAVAQGGTGSATTSANYVFAGPTSGSGAPSFRALSAGDYPAMVGANGSTAGTAGAVPGPAATDNVKFLRGDGTWATPATAAGSTNQIQYNSGGLLSGDSNFVYSGGNVGIGTTNPDKQLDVIGNIASDNFVIRRSSDANETTMSLASDVSNYLRLTNVSGNRGVYINTYTADGNRDVFFAGSGGSAAGTPGVIRAVGNTNLIVDGNVGIGTTNPTETMQLQRGWIYTPYTASVTDGYKLGLGNTTGYIWRNYAAGSAHQAGSLNDALVLSNNWYVDDNEADVIPATGSATSAILLQKGGVYMSTGAVNTVPTPKFFLHGTSGNIGIGTTSPSAQVHVVSTAATSLLIANSASAASKTAFVEVNTANDARGRGLLMSAGDGSPWFAGVPYGGNGYTIGYNATQPEYKANSMVYITPTGNVGVGTTAPTADLQISRTGSATLLIEGDTDDVGESDVPTLRFSEDGGVTRGRIGLNSSNQFDVFNESATSLNFGTSNTTQVTITGAGKVGIGSTNPGGALDVFTDPIGYGELRLKSTGVSGSIGYYTTSGNWAAGVGDWSVGDKFVIGHLSSPTGVKFVIQGDGNVGIGSNAPAFDLDVVGNTRTTGCFKTGTGTGTTLGGTCASDARFKTDVTPISGALRRLSLLNPVNYRYKTDEFPGRGFGTDMESGFIAQELQKIFPNLVIVGDDGYLKVRYGLELQMETIAAIKDLAAENDRLKARADRAEAEVARLKAESNQFRAAMCGKFPDLPICGN